VFCVLLTVVCADSVFLTFIIYVIIVVIFYFFLEPAMICLCPSGFQQPMANKYCCLHVIQIKITCICGIDHDQCDN